MEENQPNKIVDAPVKTDKLNKEEERLCRVYWQVKIPYYAFLAIRYIIMKKFMNVSFIGGVFNLDFCCIGCKCWNHGGW